MRKFFCLTVLACLTVGLTAAGVADYAEHYPSSGLSRWLRGQLHLAEGGTPTIHPAVPRAAAETLAAPPMPLPSPKELASIARMTHPVTIDNIKDESVARAAYQTSDDEFTLRPMPPVTDEPEKLAVVPEEECRECQDCCHEACCPCMKVAQKLANAWLCALGRVCVEEEVELEVVIVPPVRRTCPIEFGEVPIRVRACACCGNCECGDECKCGKGTKCQDKCRCEGKPYFEQVHIDFVGPVLEEGEYEALAVVPVEKCAKCKDCCKEGDGQVCPKETNDLDNVIIGMTPTGRFDTDLDIPISAKKCACCKTCDCAKDCKCSKDDKCGDKCKCAKTVACDCCKKCGCGEKCGCSKDKACQDACKCGQKKDAAVDVEIEVDLPFGIEDVEIEVDLPFGIETDVPFGIEIDVPFLPAPPGQARTPAPIDFVAEVWPVRPNSFLAGLGLSADAGNTAALVALLIESDDIREETDASGSTFGAPSVPGLQSEPMTPEQLPVCREPAGMNYLPGHEPTCPYSGCPRYQGGCYYRTPSYFDMRQVLRPEKDDKEEAAAGEEEQFERLSQEPAEATEDDSSESAKPDTTEFRLDDEPKLESSFRRVR